MVLKTGLAWPTLATAMLAALVMPASAGDISAGRAKAQQCAACHGMDGISRQPDAPHLAGQSAIYLREQLKAYRSGQRSAPQMSVIARELSDEDIADLTAWYSAIEIEATPPETD